MTPTIALIAPGAMGAALGQCLVVHGLRVLTSLDGRSEASVMRARQAGMQATDIDGLMQADLLLSVVPPAEAEALAESLAPHLAASPRPPIYCDLNAVSPTTLARVEARVRAAGAEFVDGGIIGPPPSESRSPRIYVAGTQAPRLAVLNDHGLSVITLDGPSGSASALKMCFAGINKGMTALTTIMLLAAGRSGAGDALRQELAQSLPEVISRIDSGIPDMLPKAWRWHPEMREIADFLDACAPGHHDSAGRQTFEGFAELYAQLGDPASREPLQRVLMPLIDTGTSTSAGNRTR